MDHGRRRIVVLGGAGGIGRALVASLDRRGDEVVVLDLPASLQRHPPAVPAIPVDATSEASVADAVAAVAALVPAVDGFVNLVGYNSRLQPLAEMERTYFDDIVDGNLRAVFLSTRAIIPLLAEGSSIVLTASGLASMVRPGYGPYSASKAAVIALAKVLALECAPRVRVNTVAPAAVDTAFLRGGTGRSDETGPTSIDLSAYVQAIPMKRVATPDDIVGPIEFLLGNGSGFMTGQVLWINGGAFMP